MGKLCAWLTGCRHRLALAWRVRAGRYLYAPWWINLLYHYVEWLDYNVLSLVSSTLLRWRTGLLDKYCRCPKCLGREKEKQERERETGGPDAA